MRWGLTLRGWALLLFLGCAVVFAFVRTVYGFLAVTDRVPTDVLVVEGWVHVSAIKIALAEYQSGSYRQVFTTGGPIQGSGGYTNDYNTSASVGATRLRALGFPEARVQMVPSRVADRDRTFHSAVALREWLKVHDPAVTRINIVTEDVHARRTRLLFQKAFGDTVQVGIIAAANPDYDAAHWWRYSEGVRETVGETIAYAYARLFFRVPNAP